MEMGGIGLGLVVCGIGLIIGIFLFIRFAKLPPWTHRDVLAFVALIGTIGGAMILTLLKWQQSEKFNAQSDRLINELVRERPSQLNDAVGGALSTIIDSLTWDLKLTSAGIIVVLLSLGLVISARTLKAKVLGSEIEMGTGADGRPAVPVIVEQPAAKPVPTSEAAPAIPAAPVDMAPTSRK